LGHPVTQDSSVIKVRVLSSRRDKTGVTEDDPRETEVYTAEVVDTIKGPCPTTRQVQVRQLVPKNGLCFVKMTPKKSVLGGQRNNMQRVGFLGNELQQRFRDMEGIYLLVGALRENVFFVDSCAIPRSEAEVQRQRNNRALRVLLANKVQCVPIDEIERLQKLVIGATLAGDIEVQLDSAPENGQEVVLIALYCNVMYFFFFFP
jgi:hypothetical protein